MMKCNLYPLVCPERELSFVASESKRIAFPTTRT